MPPYYVSMIEAGEAGGSLPETMTRLAVLMQRQEELRERVRSALVYPALLATMVLVTLIVLLTFVLPRFEAMFLESEAPLPWSTRAVLALGRVVADFWWLMAAGVTAATAAFLAWYRSPEGRLRFDRWFARSRLSFGIPAAIDTARLLRTLGTLTANGQPLPAALRIARGTLVNRALTAALEQIILEVNAGAAFSGALARHALFPPIAVQLTRVGEETGRLHEMFLSAADALEERSHIQLGRLLTLFVPLLTILMGLVVAGLIGSVLVGLLSVNEIAF
jgi:general secretion pathway protein F